jgi:excisionase family DNA binding protein
MGAKMRGTAPVITGPAAEFGNQPSRAVTPSDLAGAAFGESPPTSLLLSVEESAAQLRIGRSRMFELIRRGEVLSVKVGGSRRVPYDSLRDYVKRLVAEQGTPDGDLPAA